MKEQDRHNNERRRVAADIFTGHLELIRSAAEQGGEQYEQALSDAQRALPLTAGALAALAAAPAQAARLQSRGELVDHVAGQLVDVRIITDETAGPGGDGQVTYRHPISLRTLRRPLTDRSLILARETGYRDVRIDPDVDEWEDIDELIEMRGGVEELCRRVFAEMRARSRAGERVSQITCANKGAGATMSLRLPSGGQ